MRLILQNGLVLYYETYGRGRPVIFIHGNGEDHHIFKEIISGLENSMKLFLVDSRGHGKSSHTTDFSYQKMAQDYAEFMEKLDLQDVVIVGFSDGAIIATLLSIQSNRRLAGVVSLGLNTQPDNMTLETQEWLIGQLKERPDDPLLHLMQREPNITNSDLAKIKIPYLLIAGDQDVYTQDQYEEIQRQISLSDLLILKGEDHSSYIVNSDQLVDPILRFIEKYPL